MNNEEKNFQKTNINWLVLFYSTPLINSCKIKEN